MSEAETIKLLKPIAAALDYAHGEKVIHRDVKPSNIIIRKDGHPFILDFGIAREIQESMTRVTGRTISGTLLYMSPEQLRGAPPTPAQDVYSLGSGGGVIGAMTKRDENKNVEYKESWHDKYLEWICGYANAKGGTLYIGD